MGHTSHPTSESGTVNERLWDLYELLCMVELVKLDEFVTRVKSGELGDVPTEDMVSFLREIEANMLQNIEVKAMEHQAYPEMANHVTEDTHKVIDELIEVRRRS